MRLGKQVCAFIFLNLMVMVLALSCSKTDTIVDPPPPDPGPQFSGISLSTDNRLLQLDFSESVYKSGSAGTELTRADFQFSLTGGSAQLDSVQLHHTAGSKIAEIVLYYSGLPDGNELLTISVVPDAIINLDGLSMKSTEQIQIRFTDSGIIGQWVSVGNDLSPLFLLFGFDSVFMSYATDGTYLFESFTNGGIHNMLSGTFVQQKSSVEGIRVVALNQVLPVTSGISGIFGISANDIHAMQYETVQTTPAVEGLTPPLPEAGFGSSGLLGSDNIQVFRRVYLP